MTAPITLIVHPMFPQAIFICIRKDAGNMVLQSSNKKSYMGEEPPTKAL